MNIETPSPTNPDYPVRGPANPLEWALVMLLLYNVMFVTPFIFKMFFWELNYALRVASYGLTLLFMLRHRIDLDRVSRRLNHPAIFLFALCYLGYMVVLTLSCLLSYKVHVNWMTGLPYNSLPHLINVWLLTFFGFAYVVYFDLPLFRWVMDRYADLILICAIAGIVLVPLLYFQLIEPLTMIEVVQGAAENLPDQNAYQPFYGLGFARDVAPVFGMTLPRIQSFAIEGAGFAYPLLTAIIWAAHRGRPKAVIAMSVALVLTWTIGALTFCLLIPVFYLLHRPVRAALLVIGGIAMFSVLLGTEVIHSGQVAAYLDTKFGGTETSLGGRFTDLANVMSLVLDEQWLGFGAGATVFVIPVSVATSLISALTSAGVPGLLLWLCAYFVLGFQAVRAAMIGDSEQRAVGLILLSVFFLSFQATGLDAALIYWFLVALGLVVLFGRPLPNRGRELRLSVA